MANTICKVPFQGTPEQEAQLKKIISEHKDERGCLMPVMQKAQDIYGYLPIEVQQIISDQTGIPMSKIYGVVTFYSQFNLYPKGKYQISVYIVNINIFISVFFSADKKGNSGHKVF